jgi:hypothetical protein
VFKRLPLLFGPLHRERLRFEAPAARRQPRSTSALTRRRSVPVGMDHADDSATKFGGDRLKKLLDDAIVLRLGHRREPPDLIRLSLASRRVDSAPQYGSISQRQSRRYDVALDRTRF